VSLEEKPQMSLSVDLLGVKEPLKRGIFSSSNGQQGDLGTVKAWSQREMERESSRPGSHHSVWRHFLNSPIFGTVLPQLP